MENKNNMPVEIDEIKLQETIARVVKGDSSEEDRKFISDLEKLIGEPIISGKLKTLGEKIKANKMTMTEIEKEKEYLTLSINKLMNERTDYQEACQEAHSQIASLKENESIANKKIHYIHKIKMVLQQLKKAVTQVSPSTASIYAFDADDNDDNSEPIVQGAISALYKMKEEARALVGNIEGLQTENCSLLKSKGELEAANVRYIEW